MNDLMGKKTIMNDLMKGRGHIYGNFHQYYEFHPANSRSGLFPKGFFSDLWRITGSPSTFRILDVGCNEGDLTIMLLEIARVEISCSEVCIEVYGMDIDIELIERAKKKCDNLKIDNAKIKFIGGDFMDAKSNSLIDLKMNLISLFSVTMWIHLNHGDVGLETLIERCADLLDTKTSTGALLVEPQCWRSYKNARKRARHLELPEPKFWQSIKYRNPEEDIERIVKAKTKFNTALLLGKEMWGRSCSVYLVSNDDAESELSYSGSWQIRSFSSSSVTNTGKKRLREESEDKLI